MKRAAVRRDAKRLADLAPEDRALVRAARAVRRRAHAPYSDFKVGAAIRLRNGKTYTGCNVENASLGAGICAERGAILQAVADGLRPGRLTAVAVFTEATHPTVPCGICLQVLVEFGRDVDVFLANAHEVRVKKLAELYPDPFTHFESAAEE